MNRTIAPGMNLRKVLLINTIFTIKPPVHQHVGPIRMTESTGIGATNSCLTRWTPMVCKR